MQSSDSDHQLDWRQTVPAVLIFGGGLLILASILLPSGALSPGNWTKEQAKKYQTAALKLHSLSHTAVHATPDKQKAIRKELQEAEADYAVHRAELDAAIAAPNRMASLLRYGGVALIIAGGTAVYFRRETLSD